MASGWPTILHPPPFHPTIQSTIHHQPTENAFCPVQRRCDQQGTSMALWLRPWESSRRASLLPSSPHPSRPVVSIRAMGHGYPPSLHSHHTPSALPPSRREMQARFPQRGPSTARFNLYRIACKKTFAFVCLQTRLSLLAGNRPGEGGDREGRPNLATSAGKDQPLSPIPPSRP